ncbi:MAG: hypothetical protein AB1480_18305, partial [Nitrospirota bacterium]
RTQFGGIFLFLPYLVRIPLDEILHEAGFPGSKMIPAAHAIRSLLALKLFGNARHSHVKGNIVKAVLAGAAEEGSKEFYIGYKSLIECGTPAEGAAFVVLEKGSEVIKRGIRPLAKISGRSSRTIKSDDSAKVKKLVNIMQEALDDAQLVASDIEVVFLSHNGSKSAQEVEKEALSGLFCKKIPKMVGGPKPFGDTYSAGGLMQLVAAIPLLKDYKKILINAFGNTGNCATLIIESPEN